ncbi:MAG: hypothetical protein AAFW89_09400 [Bacteroidota bacterium]
MSEKRRYGFDTRQEIKPVTIALKLEESFPDVPNGMELQQPKTD